MCNREQRLSIQKGNTNCTAAAPAFPKKVHQNNAETRRYWSVPTRGYCKTLKYMHSTPKQQLPTPPKQNESTAIKKRETLNTCALKTHQKCTGRRIPTNKNASNMTSYRVLCVHFSFVGMLSRIRTTYASPNKTTSWIVYSRERLSTLDPSFLESQ